MPTLIRLLCCTSLLTLCFVDLHAFAQRPSNTDRSPERSRQSRGRENGGRSRAYAPPILDAKFIQEKLPEGVRYVSDVVFKKVDDIELKLDLLLPPAKANQKMPLAIWIHGGAWMRGNKAIDLHRFDQMTARILEQGIAFVSIEYRLSGQAQFPAQIQDCNDAISFVLSNSDQYGLDPTRVVVMGTSAGGHLASLVGTSTHHAVPEFYSPHSKPATGIVGIVNFYGPSDLLVLQGKRDEIDYENDVSPEARFLGHSPIKRPDVATAASPTHYVSPKTPPFLIFHGDQDARVPISQSILLDAWLKAKEVESKLVIVPGADHGDQKFDDEAYNEEVVAFLKSKMRIP